MKMPRDKSRLDFCAVQFPPLKPPAGAKAPSADWSIRIRDENGEPQWVYKGKPVYTWPEDQEPGDKYGDNYLKVWHVVPQ